MSAAPVLRRNCHLCGGHLETDEDSHAREDCVRHLQRRTLVLLSNRDKAVGERNDALRRMEDAEAREKRLQTALSALLTADDAAVRVAARRALPDAASVRDKSPCSLTEVISDEELFAIEAVAATANEPVALISQQVIRLLARLRRAETKAVIAGIKDEDPVVWGLRLTHKAWLDGMLAAAAYCKEWGYRHADERGPIEAAYQLAKDLRVLVKRWGGDDGK